MGLVKCAVFLCLNGICGFFLGRILPKRWFLPDAWIFRSRGFERHGKIYEKLGIRRWHKRVPDMSRIFPALMPPKNLTGDFSRRLPEMIRETCVAELIHTLLSLTGLYCLWLWPGWGGVTVSTIHFLLLNLPFILIQRYERPRLIRLQAKMEERKRSVPRP